jgi:hypothetical protein
MPKAKQPEWRGVKAPRIETCPNVGVDIWMAGDIAQAKQVCREFCRDVGLCVTVEAVDYIYTGGEETGFRVGLINYARFPKPGIEIQETAMKLASVLRERLCQQSFTIETGAQSIWVSHRPDEARS